MSTNDQKPVDVAGDKRGSAETADASHHEDKERKGSVFGKVGNTLQDLALRAFTGYVPSKDQMNPYVSNSHPIAGGQKK